MTTTNRLTIYDWQWISNLRMWQQIILMKNIRWFCSTLYWQTLTYIGESSSWKAQFLLELPKKFNWASNRSQLIPKLNQGQRPFKILTTIRTHTCEDEDIPTMNGGVVYRQPNTQDSSLLKYTANDLVTHEKYKSQAQSEDKNAIAIEIDKHEFWFCYVWDYNTFISNDPHLLAKYKSVSNEARFHYWTIPYAMAIYAEDSVEEAETKEYSSSMPIEFVQTVLRIYEKNYILAKTYPNTCYPILLPAWGWQSTNSSWIFSEPIWRFDSDDTYLALEFPQLIDFRYPKPTWQGTGFMTTNSYHYFCWQESTLCSNSVVEYKTHANDVIRLLEANWGWIAKTIDFNTWLVTNITLATVADQNGRIFVDSPTITHTTTIRNPYAGDVGLTYAESWADNSTWQVHCELNNFGHYSPSVRNITQIEYKYSVWDKVLLKNFQTDKLNRDFIIKKRTTASISQKPAYELIPASKKPITASERFVAKEADVELIPTLKERKFVLKQDFWKYKAWTAFNKTELVQKLWKFCDATEPYILNNLFICAE